MNRHELYEAVKKRAREIRGEFNLRTPRILKSDLRRIYRAQGIKIDILDVKLRNLRGAYYFDETGASVLLPKRLPDEPKIFTMGHELKHHLYDREAMQCGTLVGDDVREISAEVFAAELIFPEADFAAVCGSLGISAGSFRPEDLIRIKRATQTTMSYAALVKRAERYGVSSACFAPAIQWRKLEESIYGPPTYKRVQANRKRRLLVGR